VSGLLLIQAAVLAEKLDGDPEFNDSGWASVLVPLWIILGAFCCCTVSPLVRYRGAYSGSTSDAQGLWAHALPMCTGAVAVALLLAAGITLTMRLDGSPSVSWTAVLALVIAFQSYVFLWFAYMAYSARRSTNRHNNVICCMPLSHDPADIPDLPSAHAPWYYVASLCALWIAVIISTALLLAHLAHGRPWSMDTVNLPWWIATGIVAVATCAVVVDHLCAVKFPLGSEHEAKPNMNLVITVASMLIFLLLAVLFSVLVTHVDDIHISFFLLYGGLGLMVLVSLCITCCGDRIVPRQAYSVGSAEAASNLDF